MGFSTSLVFFYGVEETDEIRKKCRVKTVMKDTKSCATIGCVKGAFLRCERCNNDLRPGDKFCGACGISAKSDGEFCRHCGQKKVAKPKQVTT